MYTLLGRALLGLIVGPDSSNYIWRFFCRLTDPFVAPIAPLTPKAAAPVVVWLFGFVWLFWLRVGLLYLFLLLRHSPAHGLSAQDGPHALLCRIAFFGMINGIFNQLGCCSHSFMSQIAVPSSFVRQRGPDPAIRLPDGLDRHHHSRRYSRPPSTSTLSGPRTIRPTLRCGSGSPAPPSLPFLRLAISSQCGFERAALPQFCPQTPACDWHDVGFAARSRPPDPSSLARGAWNTCAAIAFATVLRACGFGSLAIFCVMIGLSFEPRAAFQAGGFLTTLMTLILASRHARR